MSLLSFDHSMIQIVTGVEVTIGNCFPEVGEILPTQKVGGNISPTETISNSDR